MWKENPKSEEKKKSPKSDDLFLLPVLLHGIVSHAIEAGIRRRISHLTSLSLSLGLPRTSSQHRSFVTNPVRKSHKAPASTPKPHVTLAPVRASSDGHWRSYCYNASSS